MGEAPHSLLSLLPPHILNNISSSVTSVAGESHAHLYGMIHGSIIMTYLGQFITEKGTESTY